VSSAGTEAGTGADPGAGMHTRVWAATHVGRVRRRNEDSYGVTGATSSRTNGEVITADIVGGSCLAVVADGLGGHPCGDLASRLAVEHLLATNPANTEELVVAVHDANERIYVEMQQLDECVEMGTTVAAVLVTDDGVTVANVGDSTVFEFHDGRLHQLSVDDVPPGTAGLVSAQVTQTLGGKSRRTAIDPHVCVDDDVSGQRRLLLCSDGLTNFVTRPQIADALALDGAAAVEALVASALAAGGRDNVTVALLDVRWNP
jgi:serine/threonine protein phosphatase PrpC